ncbi:MAG: SpoIIE family protein phosphatase, partial [Selenomonadaceae bacterium]|nr:SpoIIE family protein phosphatase [Selenomonadaceae bacterium]
TAEAGKLTVGLMPNDENTNIPFITVSTPYYNNDKLAGVANIAISTLALRQILEERGINEAINVNFILNSEGKVVIFSENGGLANLIDMQKMTLPERDLSKIVKSMTAGETGVEPVMINGESYYLAYSPIPSFGWSLGTLAKAEEIIDTAKEARLEADLLTDKFIHSMSASFRENLSDIGCMLPIILIVLLAFGALTAKRFVAPILQITEGVREIAKGNLDKKLRLRTGDEFEELANSIDLMTDDLKAHMDNIEKITKDKQRIATELSLAQDIQIGMLPDMMSVPANNRGYDLYATMEAAKIVGGDFYDFYPLGDDKVAVTIADVSGKSVPAALFMAISKTILQNCLSEGHFASLSDMAAHVNNILEHDNTKMMFVTAFIGVLNLKTGSFSFVNCGHNPPLIYRAKENKYEYLKVKRNTALGIMSDMDFVEQEITLFKGDALFLYTDGVTEAYNNSEEMYGEERLETALNAIASPTASSKEILTHVRSSLKAFVKDADQFDDITMLGIRYLG